MLLAHGLEPASKKQLIAKVELNSKTPGFENLLDFLKEAGWIGVTNPESPNSPKQKYYTTTTGKAVLAANKVSDSGSEV